jgi:hypothetical protein
VGPLQPGGPHRHLAFVRSTARGASRPQERAETRHHRRQPARGEPLELQLGKARATLAQHDSARLFAGVSRGRLHLQTAGDPAARGSRLRHARRARRGCRKTIRLRCPTAARTRRPSSCQTRRARRARPARRAAPAGRRHRRLGPVRPRRSGSASRAAARGASPSVLLRSNEKPIVVLAPSRSGVIEVLRAWDPKERRLVAPKSAAGTRRVPIAGVLRDLLEPDDRRRRQREGALYVHGTRQHLHHAGPLRAPDAGVTASDDVARVFSGPGEGPCACPALPCGEPSPSCGCR